MDEPCSALDPIATSRIEDLMYELKENYCIVIVTHSPTYAAYGRRTVHLFDGHVVTEQIAASGTLS